MVSTTSAALVGDLHQDIARNMMMPSTSFYICKILPHDETLVNASVDGASVFRMCARLTGGGPRQPQPSHPRTWFGDWTCSNPTCRAPRCWPTRNQCFRCGMPRYVTSGQNCPPPPWAPPGPPACSIKGTAAPWSSLWPGARRPSHQSSLQQETSGTCPGWTSQNQSSRS